MPLYIVADPAYPLLPWLRKAFAHNPGLNQQQKRFHTCLSKARFVVEHAFGRLKGRWRCILKRNDTTLEYIIVQISACCILHNLCELQQEEFLEEWWLPPEVNDNEDDNGDDNEDDEEDDMDDHEEINDDNDEPEDIRNALMNSIE